MQKFVLIAVAVCNLVAGIEVSSDIEDVWLESGLMDNFASASHDSGEGPDDNGIDGGDCDHCCHASAHLVAFAVSPLALERSSTATQVGLRVEQHGRAGRAPPLPPPIA